MKKKLGINLLKNRKTLSEKDLAREKDLLRYSVIGVVSTVVLVMGILGYQMILARQLIGVEETITRVSGDVSEHAEASAQQIYLKSRLKLISAFIDMRSIAREAIQEIFSIEIPGVVVSGVSFEEDDRVSVQFTSADVLSLEKALEYLQDGGDVFTQIVSDGVVRTGEGQYQLHALLTLSAKRPGK